MKKQTIFTLFLLLLNYTVCFSQDIKMTKEVEKITKLGKSAIVQMALELIDKEVSIDNFTRSYVTTDGKEIFISLRNPIKYLSKESIFYFDVAVQLLGRTTSYGPMSNPATFNQESQISFYKETEEAKKHIQFITKSINNSAEVGSIDIENFEDNMIIREAEKHYDIAIVSKFQESFYKIEKESGKIFDAEHAHLIPDPHGSKFIFKEIH